VTVLARLRRWGRYQRELNRLISERADAGYNVRTEHVERFREQARRAAGYETL
jgi:hypothetical protein